MKASKIFILIATLISFESSKVYAYSLRTVHEDAADSAPELLFFVLASILFAYPILLFACRYKLTKPKELSKRQYWKSCVRISAKQLLPLLFLTYVVGTFVLISAVILLSIISSIVLKLNNENTLFQSVDFFMGFLQVIYLL